MRTSLASGADVYASQVASAPRSRSATSSLVVPRSVYDAFDGGAVGDSVPAPSRRPRARRSVRLSAGGQLASLRKPRARSHGPA